MDRVTLGWQLSDLIIIAARPSMGKTAFVLSMARNMAVDHEQGVAFFSLEMSSVQLMMRLIIAETGLIGQRRQVGPSDARAVAAPRIGHQAAGHGAAVHRRHAGAFGLRVPLEGPPSEDT